MTGITPISAMLIVCLFAHALAMLVSVTVTPDNSLRVVVTDAREIDGAIFTPSALSDLTQPHWFAIASAIPWNVALLIFQRSALGGRLYQVGRLLPLFVMCLAPLSTMFVGFK